MGENAWWKGKVVNNSKYNVWIIYDKAGVMYASKLSPNTKSPDIDVDGVKGFDNYKINGYEGWWKLKNGAEVEIWDSNGLLLIRQTSFIGTLLKLKEEDWGSITYLGIKPLKGHQ